MRLEDLPCVPQAARYNPRYVGDAVIQHYRALGLKTLARDLGIEVREYTIFGATGILTMRDDGTDMWSPIVAKAPVPPRPLDGEDLLERLGRCSKCEAFADDKCTARGCGCAGEGAPYLRSSRCPLGRWRPVSP